MHLDLTLNYSYVSINSNTFQVIYFVGDCLLPHKSSDFIWMQTHNNIFQITSNEIYEYCSVQQ